MIWVCLIDYMEIAYTQMAFEAKSRPEENEIELPMLSEGAGKERQGV